MTDRENAASQNEKKIAGSGGAMVVAGRGRLFGCCFHEYLMSCVVRRPALVLDVYLSTHCVLQFKLWRFRTAFIG
jgi:hypothetical protein